MREDASSALEAKTALTRPLAPSAAGLLHCGDYGARRVGYVVTVAHSRVIRATARAPRRTQTAVRQLTPKPTRRNSTSSGTTMVLAWRSWTARTAARVRAVRCGMVGGPTGAAEVIGEQARVSKEAEETIVEDNPCDGSGGMNSNTVQM